MAERKRRACDISLAPQPVRLRGTVGFSRVAGEGRVRACLCASSAQRLLVEARGGLADGVLDRQRPTEEAWEGVEVEALTFQDLAEVETQLGPPAFELEMEVWAILRPRKPENRASLHGFAETHLTDREVSVGVVT